MFRKYLISAYVLSANFDSEVSDASYLCVAAIQGQKTRYGYPYFKNFVWKLKNVFRILQMIS